jgi:hypothetical protein
MATESVSSVVIDVLKNNREAGKSLIKAYRTGGTRILRGCDAQWNRVIDLGGDKLNKKIRARLLDGGQVVSEFLAGQIVGIAHTVGRALDTAYDQAASLVSLVSTKVDAIDLPYAPKYVGYVSAGALPGVKLVRKVSETLTGGMDSFYGQRQFGRRFARLRVR